MVVGCVVFGLFFVGGDSGFLFGSNLWFFDGTWCWDGIFGHIFALFVAAQGKYFASGSWQRIENRVEMEKIISLGL